VRRIYLDVFLLRVFSPSLGRDVGNCAFENLQESLLHAFPASDAGVGERRQRRRGLPGLLRPVASSDEQADFWVRHTRIGVLLSMAAAAFVLVYALTADGPERARLIGIAVVTGAASPLVLLLPVRRIAQRLSWTEQRALWRKLKNDKALA